MQRRGTPKSPIARLSQGAPAAVLALLLACGGGGGGKTRSSACENLVLVVIDTLRADHVGALGCERPTTPNIDAFAASGTVFAQAVAPSSWTRPSMAALMTGVLPSTAGLTCHNFRVPKGDCDVLRSSLVTLAEIMRQRGFRTCGIVANINVDPVFGFDQGFEEYVSVPELLRGSDSDWRNRNDWLRGTTDAVTSEALAWLERTSGEEPFLLYLHYLDPHEPYLPPESEPEFAAHDYALAEAARESAALYDGEIHFVDRQLQRVLADLERRGLADSTAVVLVSDHGEEFLEHGGTHHGFSMYDEQLLVPLLMRLPGLSRPGAVIDAQVSLLDVLPTLLEAFDLPAPGWLQGRSLVPALLGEPLEPVAVVSEWGYRPLSSLRAPPWKLIHDHERGTSELYDIVRDPGEQADVAAEHRELVARMERQLVELRERAAADGARFAGDDEDVQLSDEQIQQLEAIGYTGD